MDSDARKNETTSLAALMGLETSTAVASALPAGCKFVAGHIPVGGNGEKVPSDDRATDWVENVTPQSAESVDAAFRWMLPAFDSIIIILAYAHAFAPAAGGHEKIVGLPAFTTALWILTGHTVGLFDTRFLRFSACRMAGLIVLWLMVAGMVWAGSVIMDAAYTNEPWPAAVLTGAIGLLVARLALCAFAGRLFICGSASRQLLLVGCPSDIERSIDAIAAERPGALVRAAIGPDGNRCGRNPAPGPLRADEIVLVVDPKDPRFAPLCLRLHQLPIAVSLFDPDRGIGLIPLQRKPLSGGAQVTKRIFDVALSALLLFACAPLMLFIAGLIKCTDPAGPVFYLQRRHGLNRRTFVAYKFRSMRPDRRDERDEGARQATRDDPRVTRVGRFLRASSLDELPQLVNVLVGDMSLVGPRPHPVSLNEKYAPLLDGYMARHRVKPGITGLAQVNGLRGETDTLEKMKRRIELDFRYIEQWSLWLDVTILLRTAFAVVKAENAY